MKEEGIGLKLSRQRQGAMYTKSVSRMPGFVQSFRKTNVAGTSQVKEPEVKGEQNQVMQSCGESARDFR